MSGYAKNVGKNKKQPGNARHFNGGDYGRICTHYCHILYLRCMGNNYDITAFCADYHVEMAELLCPRAAIDADGTIICTAGRPMLCIMYDCNEYRGGRGIAMPMQFDLTGKKFHKLRVIKYLGTHEGRPCQWLCECDCGKIMTTKGHHLRSGNTKSCGCMQKGKIKHGHANRLDGKRKRSPEYQSWQCMKSRCTNKNRGDYKHYGGRGIRICERWLNSFENFLADMGNRPAGKTLDRKDNDGDYSLENCVWSTTIEQTNNKRDCIFITYKNERLTVKQWGRKLGINADYIYAKIRRGKSHTESLLCVIDRFKIKF